MNTLEKRAVKVLSLFSSYLFFLAVAIFASSLLMNRHTPSASPTVHQVKDTEIVFTPNLDLSSTNNYNVKEIYVYLVHQVEENGKVYERTVWDRLVKKNNTMNLNRKERAILRIARGKTFRKGKLFLKGSYFHYVGAVKDKVFSEFSPKISQ